MNNIYIYSNKSRSSNETEQLLHKKLDNAGFHVLHRLTREADLMVCIGGDGTFLEAIHKHNFPKVPIFGINTGHLGFFEEIMPDQLDDFIFHYKQGDYTLQDLSTVQIKIYNEDECYEHVGLNEVIVKGAQSSSIHMNMSIGNSFIERFSGDGIVVSTPAGSTAYNYSLGGSIVDPRLKLLQVTPIAPMNTTAYRAFTSSILLPSDLSLNLIPDMQYNNTIAIVSDGYSTVYEGVNSISVGFSDKIVQLMRFEGYDFWTKVKSKFL